MNVNVKFFASLRDRMGRGEDSVTSDGKSMSVTELWGKLSSGEALPNGILVAVNMEYTDGDHALKDGDEVAFFPPVTGG